MKQAKQNKVDKIVDQLKTEMETLRATVSEEAPSTPARRRLESGVREIVDGLTMFCVNWTL